MNKKQAHERLGTIVTLLTAAGIWFFTGGLLYYVDDGDKLEKYRFC